MLDKVKLALQITSTTLDDELTDLINASILDLGLAGVDDDISTSTTDPMVQRVIISYVAYQFELVHGSLDRAKALKEAYDEQKRMLGMASGYTTWSE